MTKFLVYYGLMDPYLKMNDMFKTKAKKVDYDFERNSVHTLL